MDKFMNKSDEYLINKGIRILPYIGKDYSYGIDFNDEESLLIGSDKLPRKKLLIIDEFPDAADDLTGKINPLMRREKIDKYKNSIDKTGCRWMRSLSKVFDSISTEVQNVEDHLAIYDFMQASYCYKFDDIEFRKLWIKNSMHQFYLTLVDLEPDYVIVFGYRLFRELINQIDFVTEEFYCFDEFSGFNYFNLKLFKDIKFLGSHHPAVGFNVDYWSKIYHIFMSSNTIDK